MRSLLFSLVVGLAILGASIEAKAQTDDRAHLLEQFNLQKTFRAFERDTRHLHYVLVTALLASYGGWQNLPENYNATQAGLIDGVVEKMSPATNRLKARASKIKGITESEVASLVEAAANFQTLFEVSIRIRDLLLQDRVDDANSLYYEEALPLFEEIWRTNYSLLAEAERRIPRR